MDNFMDKLAEKYNAQDMIRANSQAESAQMQSLQEQVEAYEAVLQEMRKLNYKNTELTEKMYALVDESIEKVRTLQIEAEGGANTEQVSREMTDAVNRAMSEAVSNLDETVVRSLTQTLETAIQQPADQLRQSTEDVKNSVVAVQSSADDMRNGVDSVKSSVEDMTAGMELVTSGMESVKGSVDQLNENIGSVKDEIGSVKDDIGGLQDKLFAIQQSGSNTEDMINSVAIAVKEMSEKDGSAAPSQELKDELQRICDSLKEMQDNTLSGISGQLEKMQKETLEGISGRMEVMRSMPSEEDSAKAETMQKISASLDELKADAQDKSYVEKLESISAAIEELKAGVKAYALIQESLEALSQSNNQTRDSVTEIKAAMGGLKDEEAAGRQEALLSAIGKISEENQGALEAIRALAGTGEETKSGVNGLKTANDENRAALEDIFKVLQDTKSEVQEVKAGMASGMGRGDEEVLKAINDLMGNHTEVNTNIRNLKAATDDNKNTLKSAIDSSIYGLKQDNKEIVEFLQRMNANIIKKGEDDAKAAKKEEEEAARKEEEFKLLDERFKAAEDFMHKESVKVYRNVQAVINEKNDKQKESVENSNLSIEKRIGKVKALVVINMVFTLITLATMILYIFGFLGAH